jgi:hypothetical protein
MIKAASFVAAIFAIMAGLILWKTYGPAVFFDMLILNGLC